MHPEPGESAWLAVNEADICFVSPFVSLSCEDVADLLPVCLCQRQATGARANAVVIQLVRDLWHVHIHARTAAAGASFSQIHAYVHTIYKKIITHLSYCTQKAVTRPKAHRYSSILRETPTPTCTQGVTTQRNTQESPIHWIPGNKLGHNHSLCPLLCSSLAGEAVCDLRDRKDRDCCQAGKLHKAAGLTPWEPLTLIQTAACQHPRRAQRGEEADPD